MEMRELQNYLKQNPKLLTAVYDFDKQLDKVEVFSPDSSAPKYDDFCAKLSLKSKPWLVVIDDDLKSDQADFKQTGGYYDSSCNAVVMKRSVFASFARNEKSGEYMVAHELGHAKFRQTRRHFLGRAAALVGAGVLGTGSEMLINEGTNRLGLTHAEKLEAADTIPVLSGIIAALYSHNKILDWFIRQEEFEADRIATQATSKNEIITGIGQAGIAATTIKQPEEIEKMKHMVSKALPEDASPEKRALAEALVAAKFASKRSLKEIFQKPYPEWNERIAKLEPSINR